MKLLSFVILIFISSYSIANDPNAIGTDDVSNLEEVRKIELEHIKQRRQAFDERKKEILRRAEENKRLKNEEEEI